MWKTTLCFWLALLVVVLVGTAGYQTTAAVEDTAAWVERTHEVIEALRTERIALADATSQLYARDIAGSPDLDGVRAALARAGTAARSLRSWMVDQPERSSDLYHLDAVIEMLVDASASRSAPAQREVAQTELHERVFPSLSRMVNEEKQLLSKHHRQTATNLVYLRLFLASATMLSCAILWVTFQRLRSEIASRMRSEHAVRDQEETLAITLMSIGDAVVSTDTHSRIVRMNRMAEQLTGWSACEVAGLPVSHVFRVVQEDTRVALPDPIAAALRSGAPIELPEQILLVRKDGSELPIADSCAPVHDVQGELRGAVLVFRDVSEARRAKKLREAVQHQMMFADRMAAVGTLAAGVAHEINNPLSYIAGNLELIMEELQRPSDDSASRDRDLREMAVQALRGAERVQKIVHGLKTFSRADENRPALLDLRPVLDLAINMTWNEVRHRARLIRDFRAVPQVEADEARLGQVFVNLIVNAAQAIHDGDVAANEIRVSTSTDGDGKAVVEIRDTGVGISPSDMERIFDPFFTTKPIGVGTGLGLSICHTIVAASGGQMAVSSELGRGTTFRLTFPACAGASITPDAEAEASRSSERAAVLIVDDEPQVGRMLARMLSEHDVCVVNEAREGLALIAAGKRFDVILSDLMMPQMSGMDFYAELNRLDSSLAKRVVFLTGGAFTPAAKAFLDRTANPCLDKPIDMAGVRNLVHEVIAASPRV